MARTAALWYREERKRLTPQNVGGTNVCSIPVGRAILDGRGKMLMVQYDYTKGQYYKKQYPAGTRVLLVHMNKDPRPIPDNTKGTVRLVDDIGQIHCLFDNGHSHTIVPGVDIFRRLEKDGGQ